ncbi:hypothetical protein RvY_06352 [Ramazzottius varieornatus]|uniref:Solute-binding protein family 3/N-terminal domain-containing protein n=1 Tax=Ramazzottius varieornatus TaxID=947166 RepID=A0A1D1UY86_RAMVA|nr:hypothetical protein RvY_06352 [Ramazzottius varieornatus]
MERALALCILLGVAGIVSAGYGNTGNYGSSGNMGNNGNGGNKGNTSSNCQAKQYAVEGMVSKLFLNAADANGKNSGFIIDFLELMKGASGGWFDYNLTARTDDNYGALVTDLQNKKFDIVAADFTVRSERHAVIDYLQPFLRSQIRILVNNNPSGSPTAEDGVVGDHPTWYIEDDVSVVSLLQISPNATLNDIYKQAKANNRIVDRATGVAAIVAANSPTAFIATSPGIVISNANNPNTARNSLTPDILETAYFAFALQQNQNPLRLCLNILQLTVQETGQLQTLRNQYNLN